MSRSYKHTPFSGDKKSKYAKRYANHVVRQNKLKETLPQHAGYRRMYNSWDICDYKTVGESFDQYYTNEVESWYRWRCRYPGEKFPERLESKREYEKLFIRK